MGDLHDGSGVIGSCDHNAAAILAVTRPRADNHPEAAPPKRLAKVLLILTTSVGVRRMVVIR